MSPDLPVPPIPAYKSRRGWLIAFGVVEILIGCVCLLGIVGTLLLPSPTVVPASTPPMSPVALKVLTTTIYAGIALLFLVIGVGSIRCKNWARIAMLAVSGFWLVNGLIGIVAFYLLFPALPLQSRVPPEVARTVLAVTVAIMGVIFVLIPIVFLIFYSLKSVRATCLALTPVAPVQTPVSRLPSPVVVMAVWEGIGGLAILGFLMVQSTALFGVVLRGLPAFLVLLAHTILSSVAVWLIVRRKFMGWVLALLKSAFWAISWTITLAGRDTIQLYREMGFEEKQLQEFQQLPHLQSLMWVMNVSEMGAFLIFLMYARKFFPRENAKSPGVYS